MADIVDTGTDRSYNFLGMSEFLLGLQGMAGHNCLEDMLEQKYKNIMLTRHISYL